MTKDMCETLLRIARKHGLVLVNQQKQTSTEVTKNNIAQELIQQSDMSKEEALNTSEFLFISAYPPSFVTKE